jgi:hypothetical protein
MSRRLQPVILSSGVMLFAAGAATIRTFGWLWLVPGGMTAVSFFFLTRRLNTFRRPDPALAAQWLAAELLLGAGIALANGPREYLLIVLVIPAAFGSIVFAGGTASGSTWHRWRPSRPEPRAPQSPAESHGHRACTTASSATATRS